MLNFHVGIKIRVSMWSFLSVVHPLLIHIPMYEKKVRVQQENSKKFTYPTRGIPIGKYTAHYDYTEEEVRRISIAAAILVSAAALEVGGALASGRVTHMVAYDHENHDAPNVIKEERERERRERERRGGERGAMA